MPYKRGKSWMAQVRLNGEKVRKTFPTKSKAIAWEVSQREKTNQAPLPNMTVMEFLGDWAVQYLNYAKIKFSEKTYSEKCRMFKLFFLSIDPEQRAFDLTAGKVLAFLQEQAEKRSGYAANKDRKNLVAAWNWGVKYLGLPTPNPCLVDRFPEQRQVRYVPSERDFWKVYDKAETEQDFVMLLSYLHLAARKTELFNLRWEDVDFADSRVRLYTRKRRDGSLEYDWLPMTEALYQALLSHRQKSINEWVFPDPLTGKPYWYRYHWMRRLCDKAKLKRFGLHSIRHLTASILAKENVSMIDIQAVLRHKNLSTTERYIRRLTTVRSALKVLPGRKSPHCENEAHIIKIGNQA